MRFSPRFSIRKKITFTSYSFFFSFFLPSPGPLCFRFRPGEFVLEFYHVIFCVPGPYISGRVFGDSDFAVATAPQPEVAQR